MSNHQKMGKGKKGQSLVETALFFTILLILLGGAIDIGGAFFAFINIRDAAEEGAIFASYNQNETSIKNHIRNSAVNPPGIFGRQVEMSTLPYSNIGISYTPVRTDPNAHCAGDSVTITITYNYQVQMPLMSTIVGSTFPLTSRVTNTVMSPFCY